METLDVIDSDEDDNEYYRPSCMFKWLRATGRRIEEAHQAFQDYHGKAGFEELGLSRPTPMPREEDDSEMTL